MIISHKHKFIFIKTVKTAGTSIEVFLSQHCGKEDIVTPIVPGVIPHVARNYRGLSNPVNDLILNQGRGIKNTFRQFFHLKRFYSHIPARLVRARLSPIIWNSYFKFCVERNPWDKTISHYHMINYRSGGNLSIEEYFLKGNFCVNYPIYTDGGDNLLVDRVVRYENLNDDLDEVFNLIGIPFDGSLGVNAKSDYRSNRKPYQEIYSPEQRGIIESVFEKEILMHNYLF